jgi:hypothetical protein
MEEEREEREKEKVVVVEQKTLRPNGTGTEDPETQWKRVAA